MSQCCCSSQWTIEVIQGSALELYWWNFTLVIITLIEAALPHFALPSIKRNRSLETTSDNLALVGEYLDGAFAFLAFVVELFYMKDPRCVSWRSQSHPQNFLGLLVVIRVLRLVRLHPEVCDT